VYLDKAKLIKTKNKIMEKTKKKPGSKKAEGEVKTPEPPQRKYPLEKPEKKK